MPARLLTLDPPGGIDGADGPALEAALAAAGPPPSRHANTAELLRAATDGPAVPTLVVIAPGVDDPLLQARRIARDLPEARFVCVVHPGEESALRRRGAYAAPAGGRWSLARIDDPALGGHIRGELDIARQQRRLHTTLDRMRLQVRPAPLADPGEYRRLVASDRYLASVLRHAHDAIVSLDPEGRVVSWNTGAELRFGLSAEQARRRPFATLFRDADAAGDAIASALAGSHRMIGLEVERGGQVRHVDANFGELRDDAATVVGVVAILRDITERHRAEEELRASSRQKDEFLAMLAHELRNPLAPIRAATQVLGMIGHSDPRAAGAVAVLERQTAHMAGLIDDLLDVARVTRGAVALELESLALADVLRDAVEQARALIDSRGHRLHADAADPGLRVRGDRKRLTQVFANLLVNAAKYTPRGGDIHLRLSGDARNVRVCVADTGIGMDADLQARVFDLFVQGARTPDRSAGGLGVGLALVRSLVAMHGGHVSAHSEGPGRGSRFDVLLPRLQEAPAENAPGVPDTRPARAGQRLRLMVVDDNEDAARTLGVLLQALGHRVDVEIDPRAALARASREMPDALILDIGMPHLDGYELARRIRGLHAPHRPVLIALTGYGHQADRDRAAQAGFDHHLVKPLDPPQLVRVLDGVQPGEPA
ncbi:ATP-binding protein [Lysobacter sp. N42]|uniref:hybrid sensor histidine kinase/response regulator n=1 Tax=Lysobacter sp. N42 TaxID=2545719 RepID=UPI0010452764|nr:ATP-binding protein [Lysobacter sp. N42]TCZ85024.1 response regulator [Lysobacter sp. N42]